MRLYLADGGSNWKSALPEPENYHGVYLLQSFFYADAFTERVIIPSCKDFLCDSGAFTFMQSSKHSVDWKTYADSYADFIVRNGIDKYFELDVDSVIGYEQVKKLRNRLEMKTGRKCIPVWHSNRGKEEFIQMCKEYDYVALGGLVGGAKEYSRQYWKYFPWFINTAHENGSKIHALGFTSIEGMHRYRFDSVDSTSWNAGNRFNGVVYRFTGSGMGRIQKPSGKIIGNHRALAKHNFKEWVKLQRYADKFL